MEQKLEHKVKFKLVFYMKKLFLGFTLCICFLGLASCASVEHKALSQNFTCVSCTYSPSNDTTKVVWRSTLTNESIYDIGQVYFKFDLYNEDGFVRTTDYVNWDIYISHASSNTGNRSFTVKGNITSIKINTWYADFENLWESYESWFIGTIVGVVLIMTALVVILIKSDGNIFDLIEDNLWALYLLIPLGIVLFGSGITSWISSNWVPICIVGGGVVVASLIFGIVALIGFLAEEFDIEGRYIAISVLALLSISGFICGCIFWNWWASLIILFSAPILVFLIIFAAKLFGKIVEHFRERREFSSDESVEDEDTEDDSEIDEEKVIRVPRAYKSKISFDDIAGLEEAKQAFKEKVIMPFEHPEVYAKFGKKAGGGILLYGLPGTGKTIFAEATSNELRATFIPVKCSDIKSRWYGESEQKVKAIFDKAKKCKKAIIFFDEFEAIGSKRTDDGNNGNNDLVPEILAEMQGIGSSKANNTIMIIAATNKPWAIDSAFMRPGRFDEKIYVPLPDFKARKALFEINLKKLPIADDLDFEYLANITEGFNGADIKEVCEKLKMSAINDSIRKGSEQTIGMDDVHKIEKIIKSSVQREDIKRLESFEAGLK